MKFALISEPYKKLDSSLYMVGDGQHVKFGRAVNPFKRCKELQTGNPNRLRVMAVSFPMEETIAREKEQILLKFSKRFACSGGSEWANADAQDNFDKFLGGESIVIPEDFDIDSYDRAELVNIDGDFPNAIHTYHRGEYEELPHIDVRFSNHDEVEMSVYDSVYDCGFCFHYLLKNRSMFDWLHKVVMLREDQIDSKRAFGT